MKPRVGKSMFEVALVYVLPLAGAVLLTAAQGVRAENQVAQGEPESQARNLEGTWRVQVTIRNCHTGEALGNPFPALVTFARGGTRTETTAGVSPAMRSPALGFWQHTSGHTYRAVSEAFLFNPAGAWIGTQRLTQAIEIVNDPDEFNANAAIEIVDPGGNVVSTGCATAVGRRME